LFSWAVNRGRSAKIVVAPIMKGTVREFFPRSYEGSMQLLAEKRKKTWLSLLGR
jgi:hypothetical protein